MPRASCEPGCGDLLHTGPFSLGQADLLSTLIAGAGFRDITVQSAMKMVRFSSPEELCNAMWLVHRSPAWSPGNDHARAALLDEVSTALQPYISAEGLAFPLEAHLVRAREVRGAIVLGTQSHQRLSKAGPPAGLPKQRLQLTAYSLRCAPASGSS